MKKSTKACDISICCREEVMGRDGGRCIVCGSSDGIQIAHYISRGRLGLGIPQNLACLCHKCHFDYDNGKLHKEIQNIFRGYLSSHYKGWDETKLTYSKWRNENDSKR